MKDKSTKLFSKIGSTAKALWAKLDDPTPSPHAKTTPKQDELEVVAAAAKKVLSPLSPVTDKAKESWHKLDDPMTPSSTKTENEILTKQDRLEAVTSVSQSHYTQDGWQRLVSIESQRCSPKTLKNAWTLVNAAINEELGKSYIVRLPQIVPTREAKFLEPDEIKVFCDAVKGKKVEVAALLALHSLRRSELLAVTWEDIDLTRKTIQVRGSVVYNEAGELVEKKANKNKTSRREVPIMMDRLYELLLEQRQPSGKVVDLHPNSIGKMINTVCRSCGLPEVGVHGLRHSFASLAAHIGMPEKTTMEIGGWSNDATMKKIYTHALRTDREKYQIKMTQYYNTGSI